MTHCDDNTQLYVVLLLLIRLFNSAKQIKQLRVTFVEDQLQTTSHLTMPASGAVWGEGLALCGGLLASYRSDKETAIDRSDRQFCCYTQTENIKHFE